MDFYGRYKHKSPTKKRRDKLKKHSFLVEFQEDPVLVPVPVSELNTSNAMPCNISRRESLTSCSMCHVQSRAKFAGSAGSSVTIGVLEVPADTKCAGGIRLHERDVGGPPCPISLKTGPARGNLQEGKVFEIAPYQES